MKTLVKLSKKTSGLVQEQVIINRHIIRFCNSNDSIWIGTKRFAH